MIRAVLDANVLAPGFLSKTSGAAWLIELWHRQAYDLVVSEHLLDELARTYTDAYFRKRISPDHVERVLKLLRRRAIMTELTVTVIGAATHPEDDLILATAVSGQATVLATRDNQLLQLERFQDVEIMTPGTFLALLEEDR